MSHRNGVLAGGLFLIDYTKNIDHFPDPSGLAKIDRVVQSNGGGAFNVLVDLSRLGANFPLAAVGCIGGDPNGEWIVERCRNHRIDTSQLRRTRLLTAFTDVMTESGSGRRTFFYLPGANEELDHANFDFSRCGSRIFYLGYPGLLPKLDAVDKNGTSHHQALLASARAHGMTTAIDLVSAENYHWDSLARVLPEVDILFANEWEASRLVGQAIAHNRAFSSSQLKLLARAVLDRGVRQAVVVHTSDGAVCATSTGEIQRGSVQLKPNEVVGTCGAGDALAAGFLFAVHEQKSWDEALETGICAAAACLSDLTSSNGLRPLPECLTLGRQRGFKSF